MIAFLRKNLTGLILKPNSFCFRNFSTKSKTQPCINSEVFNVLVQKHNFAPEFASRLVTKFPQVKNPESSASILSFFRESGFSDSRLEKMVRYQPRFVCASMEQGIKPRIKFFQDAGFSSDAIAKIISGHPGILYLSLENNIIPSMSLLKRLLGSADWAIRVVRLNPRVLPANLEKTMLPNVEFLKSLGVPMERIRIILLNFPNTFLLRPEVVRKSAKKAEEMGINASHKSFIYAVPPIASMSSEAWELKMQAFRSFGFSDGDIRVMFRKSPQIFSVSADKIRKIIELLLDTRKYTISSILMYPKSLQFSIDKRYIPRLQILGTLESKNLIKDWPSLATVSVLSDDRFFDKFTCPIQQS